jgi:hypothetical protein
MNFKHSPASRSDDDVPTAMCCGKYSSYQRPTSDGMVFPYSSFRLTFAEAPIVQGLFQAEVNDRARGLKTVAAIKCAICPVIFTRLSK